MDLNKYAPILIGILILAVLFISLPTKCIPFFGKKDENVEGFYPYYDAYKRYCGSCTGRTRRSCGKCLNCGWCMNSKGVGTCVAGDSHGPFFRDDCMYWEYGNPYYHYPNDHIFPIFQVRSSYPRWRFRRNRPWRYRKH